MSTNKAKAKIIKRKIYEHLTIEPKWQAKWEKEGIYQPDFDSAKAPTASRDSRNEAKKKSKKSHTLYYNLMMFPYPSAEGLHVGFSYTSGGVDAFGRFKRMMGYEVFQPMGLDGFGIHSENHAIKTNDHPVDHAKRTEKNFYRQLHETGNSFAWKNKLETYDPEYYRWTQWIFVQLFKSGLAYKKNSPVNFCPSCKTVLSDEQVIDGHCERCDSVVEKRDLEQWFFKITKYVEPLLNNIKELNWSEKVKSAQRNWIGKKEGMRVKHKVIGMDLEFETFTAFPAWSWADTFIVIAPEHPLVKKLVAGTKFEKDVMSFIKETQEITDQERVEDKFEKKGVFTGQYAKDPFGGPDMPIWLANFALMDFGTGIIRCSSHDVRDYEFAQKYGIGLKEVVKRTDELPVNAHTNKGVLMDSGPFTGKKVEEILESVKDWIEKEGIGKREVTYHLRDWLISRQRYWGPPIPMIYCEECAKRKPKVLFIHGIAGDSNDNWFPWVKPLLEAKGYEVIIPDLPNSQNPTIAEWTNALNKLGITKQDNLSIIAHSLGGPTAIEFIYKNKLPVNKLILVAPVGKEIGKKNWDALTSGGYKFVKPILQRFSESNEHVSDIAERVEKTILYLSDNDPYIPLTVEKSYKALNPQVKVFKEHGHFSAGAGILEFPTILEEFPEVEVHNLGWYPVPDEDLPVKLPYIKNFKPLGTGKAPLANHPEFYETTCPHCGGKAIRETDVSDTFLDSAWYFLRYLATDLKHIPFPMPKEKAKEFNGATKSEIESADKRKVWLPVTSYIGGAEHSVLHLLYSRFLMMALKDMGYVDFEEPFSRFYAHGLIIKDGAKMSKSKGNVINPDDYIRKYGADTLRTYLLFLGPFNQGGDFRDSGIDGMSRFLKRVWKLLQETVIREQGTKISEERLRMMHQTIKGITEDMENLRFNTSIAKLMTYYNFLAKQESLIHQEVEVYLKLLAPFAPYMTEEMWANMGNKFSIHLSDWPTYDEKYLKKENVTIAVQVNGKLRVTVEVSVADGNNKELLENKAREDEHVKKFLENGVKKVILVPGKILNFVV